jgi:hypothetical protein
MTLQPISSEGPYILGNLIFFFYQCMLRYIAMAKTLSDTTVCTKLSEFIHLCERDRFLKVHGRTAEDDWIIKGTR